MVGIVDDAYNEIAVLTGPESQQCSAISVSFMTSPRATAMQLSPSPTDLTRNLIFAVLFDEELLINDGYIIAEPAIRDAVRKLKQSPLRQLVETGYIKILTRNQRDLGTLTKRMAEEGMEPAQDYSKIGTAFNRTLSEWCGTFEPPQADGSYLSFRGWPAYNTSQIFEHLRSPRSTTGRFPRLMIRTTSGS